MPIKKTLSLIEKYERVSRWIDKHNWQYTWDWQSGWKWRTSYYVVPGNNRWILIPDSINNIDVIRKVHDKALCVEAILSCKNDIHPIFHFGKTLMQKQVLPYTTRKHIWGTRGDDYDHSHQVLARCVDLTLSNDLRQLWISSAENKDGHERGFDFRAENMIFENFNPEDYKNRFIDAQFSDAKIRTILDEIKEKWWKIHIFDFDSWVMPK